jgi:outer membrane protein OmpA-like peptidoglycan-associated protein
MSRLIAAVVTAVAVAIGAAAPPAGAGPAAALAVANPPWQGWWSAPRPASDGPGESVPSDVLFAVGSSTLLPAADPVLRRLAAQVRGTSGPVVVVGFTDSAGSTQYNLGLSLRRAQAVAAELESLGVPAGRIQVQGLGEADPVAPNTTPSNMALNRRVEIRFGA